MRIRRGAEVDALLNEAERQGSCLYTTEKWAFNVLRRRKRAGTVIEMDHCSFIRWRVRRPRGYDYARLCDARPAAPNQGPHLGQ